VEELSHVLPFVQLVTALPKAAAVIFVPAAHAVQAPSDELVPPDW
jgi:hypothetical protein